MTMTIQLAEADHRIIDEWQRGLPLVPHPFAEMALPMGMSEGELIERLAYLQATGTVARVGATCRPNTVGASTLAALAVPEWRMDEVAAIVGAETGVNHSYLREHDWNLWFVGTAPDRPDLAAMLGRIGTATGLKVLDLPLVRPFNIDLGFRLSGPRHALPDGGDADVSALRPGDRELLHALTRGLALVPRPFATLGDALGLTEGAVIDRIARLSAARIITRLGVIVRHRALGWRANAMVVWNLPDERIEAAGRALARHPGVTLCYERPRVPGLWDHPLFSMIHGRSRAETLAVLDAARALPELAGADAQPLFSIRCFKQTGAVLAREAAA